MDILLFLYYAIFRTPKIFFGTRTHKQLGQVIKEFKKTVYAKSANMTILSSREHTCIRDLQGSYLSKTEMCRDILQKVNHILIF